MSITMVAFVVLIIPAVLLYLWTDYQTKAAYSALRIHKQMLEAIEALNSPEYAIILINEMIDDNELFRRMKRAAFRGDHPISALPAEHQSIYFNYVTRKDS